MQFFLANLYSERLSGADTSTSSQLDSAAVDAAAAEARQPSGVPALSGR
jgi:hypothetical protein